MISRRYDLFRMFGIPIRVDLSWFVIALLLTWSLAMRVFPVSYPDRPPAHHWLMALGMTLGLFGSVLLHEIGHALTARIYGISIRGITLFIFGGVAEMEQEPPHPRAEFVVAVAGPAVSVAIAIACTTAWAVGRSVEVMPAAVSIVGQLAFTNFMLAGFNMIPAFPLDGGRVLRSILWDIRKDLVWATRITSGVGSAFGIGLVVLGGLFLVQGNVIGGIWICLIGLFVRHAAKGSYQQLMLRSTLEGHPVSVFMNRHPVSVSRSISVEELVNDYVNRHQQTLFPVLDDERLIGCIDNRQIRSLPRDEWDRQTVGSIVDRLSPTNSVAPDTDALAAFGQMARSQRTRLLVAEGDRLVGLLAFDDLLRFFPMRSNPVNPGTAGAT